MAISVADIRSTQQLVERVRAGSMDALAALYDVHAARVYRVAYGLLQNAADSEDVVQDVFVGLPRALRSYRGEAGLDAWIRQVTARTALMRLRSQRRRREEPDTGQCGSAPALISTLHTGSTRAQKHSARCSTTQCSSPPTDPYTDDHASGTPQRHATR